MKPKAKVVSNTSITPSDSEGFRKKTANTVETNIEEAQQKLQEEIMQALHSFEKSVKETSRTVRSQAENEESTKKEDQRKFFFDEKVFTFSNSLLSDLFHIADYRTLYNIVVASFVALAFNLVLGDYFDKGQLFDHETLQWCFSGASHIIIPWFLLSLISFLIIPFVKWIIEQNIKKRVWIPLYCLYISAIMGIGCYTCAHFSLGMGSAFIIQCEMARIGMKMHSYLRNKIMYCTENEYKSFIPENFKTKGITSKNLYIPKIDLKDLSTEIKRFAYFFLAPTLLYRDTYTQTPNRSIKNATFHFLNFFLCIYFGFILFKTFCKDQIIMLASNFTIAQFVQCLFKLMMPSTFSILLLFFGLLHSWFNGWAEILRFPDRNFYQDWWNSEEFGTYYRKWNIVVHEFLFYYAYGDTVRFSKGRFGKDAGMFVAFAVSAVIHEVILSFVIGYFYPILFIIFTGPGIFLIRNTQLYGSKNFNIAFWLLMFIGTSLIITLYLTEHWARNNVDESLIYQTWGNYIGAIIPRTFFINFSKMR